MIEIIRLLITVLGFTSVSNGTETVNMVQFDGKAVGEYFSGEILPGGVDTQTYTPSSGCLSARYMLKGIDMTGDSCIIFVENHAKAGEAITQPRIVTNSKSLAFLNRSPLTGRIITGENGLEISISAPIDSVGPHTDR